MLVGDPLRAIARLLAGADRLCFELACKTTRDHCDRPVSSAVSRDELPGFVLDDKARMLELAAQVGCLAVLAELMDVRGCGAVQVYGFDACRAAAYYGQLEALVWLRGRGFRWNIFTCWDAARGGLLEVLCYAYDHGCTWDWRVEPDTPHPPRIRAYVEALRLAAQAPLAHGH